jgi:hypothetical protein
MATRVCSARDDIDETEAGCSITETESHAGVATNFLRQVKPEAPSSDAAASPEWMPSFAFEGPILKPSGRS